MTSGQATDPFSLDSSAAIRRFGTLADRARVLIDRQRQLWTRERSAWVVLPSVRDGYLCWLLIAADAEGERRAREVVAAFVGPATGSVEAGRLILGSSYEPDAQFRSAGINYVVLLRSGDADAAVLLEALELMTAVRAGEPELRRDVEDPIGFLLRDFRLALSSADPDTSERLLERLDATGLLATENLRFLRVDRLARLARWHELGALPWFADLARARRPRHITEYMLEALWRREFDDVAVIAEPGAALRRFEERELGTQFRSLLDAVDVPSCTGGRRLAWLSAILSGNEARRVRLLESIHDSERSVLDRLAGIGPVQAESATELGSIEQARSLLDGGDFVGAVEAAEGSPQDPALVAIAVRAAFELADSDLASRASALADSVSADSLPSTPGFLRALRDVRHRATNQCSSWGAWFSRIAVDITWPEAADVARDVGRGWDSGELRHQSIADTAANDLLSASDGVNALQVRATLDLICDLASELAGSVGASSLTDAALLVLSMQDNPSAAVRNAFFALAADVVAAGPNTLRYADLVKTATVLWERVRSRDTVSWALDVADLLAGSPAPDPAIRASFISSIGNGVGGFATRLAIHERSLLEALALECGTVVVLKSLPEEPSGPQESELWSGLTGKLVGLYSLLGGVGVRFAERVRELNPAARVEHNSDTVATDALRNLAMMADFLIVDTRHAAHAATGGIDAVRTRDRQLFPSGRGLSSFIAALGDALERDSMGAAA